ncbi:hypothetical protein, partial [Escherichia coli]|uniref:hypothetical protein n=1 Tax=Escherichia coli TaxID=562 RepID=UPI001BC84D38
RLQSRCALLIAGCGVNALSSRHVAAVVGLIRRASVASDVDCRMRGQRRILLQIVHYIKLT